MFRAPVWGSLTTDTAEAMYLPPSLSVYCIIGSLVKSTSVPIWMTSWHAAWVTILGATGCSMASSSLGKSCSLVMPMERQINSLEETSPATTGTLDSFTFSNMTGFSPFAAMTPAISYSVETCLVILVNSPLFWSSWMNPLRVKLVHLDWDSIES